MIMCSQNKTRDTAAKVARPNNSTEIVTADEDAPPTPVTLGAGAGEMSLAEMPAVGAPATELVGANIGD